MIPETGTRKVFKDALLLLGDQCYICGAGCIPRMWLDLETTPNGRLRVPVCTGCEHLGITYLTHTPAGTHFPAGKR